MTIIRKIEHINAPTAWAYIADHYSFGTTKLVALETIAKWVAEGKEIGYHKSDRGDIEEWIID